jgi:hypothetical protein
MVYATLTVSGHAPSRACRADDARTLTPSLSDITHPWVCLKLPPPSCGACCVCVRVNASPRTAPQDFLDFSFHSLQDFLDFFTTAIEDWGPWGYFAYAGAYVSLEVLAVPAIPLTMTAGECRRGGQWFR